jgi:chromosome segregation ATPase
LIEDFEELEFVITSLGDYIDRLNQENDSLRDKEAYFTSTIKDRDQEIEQLQLHLQKETAIGNNKPDVVFDKKNGRPHRARTFDGAEKKIARIKAYIMDKIEEIREISDGKYSFYIGVHQYTLTTPIPKDRFLRIVSRVQDLVDSFPATNEPG